MIRAFNCKNRVAETDTSSKNYYDLIVVGGGITGAGIALDAISRGLNVLLIEKNDFASGTSSKSTKLIHGGLRYLKQFEFALVKESGTERTIVHSLAPHLVHPEKMFLPIVKNGSFSKWMASIAITIYDILAKVKKKDRNKSLSKSESLLEEPLLKKDIVKGGVLYSEYRTDDARLTLEIIKKAHSLGADIFSYCEQKEWKYEGQRICGLIAYDHILEREIAFNAKNIISAAGPWVDDLRYKDNSLNGKKLQLSKGAHLVFDRERLPIRHSIYFDDFKGRMLFAIPRWGITYVGTTDTYFHGDKEYVTCSIQDVNYILSAVNNMFDIKPIKKSEIISSWAGLRPLIAEPGKSSNEISRKDEIFESDSGLLSIAGGKLTGYRKMAERIIDLVQEKDHSLSKKKCQTENLRLTEAPFDDYNQVCDFIQKISDQLLRKGYEPKIADYLVSNYGRHCEIVLSNSDLLLDRVLDKDIALLTAEIRYCIENENCWKPEDFFIRRSGMLYFDPGRLLKHFDLILKVFRDEFDWDDISFENIKKLSLQSVRSSINIV